VRLAAQPAGAPAPATGSSVPDADFVRMLGARQQHRGPDAQEVHTGSGWALAHQRLSIMDPQEVGAGAPASVLRGRQLRRAHSRLAHARARAAATPRPAAALSSRSHPAALRMPVLPRPRPPPRPCLAVGEPALPFRERPAAGGHPPRPQWRGARTRASAPQARRRQYASERARACCVCVRERERERERARERERNRESTQVPGCLCARTCEYDSLRTCRHVFDVCARCVIAPTFLVCLCARIYLCMYLSIHLSIYLYRLIGPYVFGVLARASIYLSTHTHTHTCIYIHTNTQIYNHEELYEQFTYIHICIYIHIHIYIYVYIHIYIYVYTNTQIYNHEELYEQLRAEGYTFTRHTKTGE
jgi:hypothetical protein